MSEYIVKIKHDKQNLPVFVIFRNDKVHSRLYDQPLIGRELSEK